MKTFRFFGSAPETHNTILMIGRALGCQHSRKMTIGDTIAANANNGNVRAIEACEAHSELFEAISSNTKEQA